MITGTVSFTLANLTTTGPIYQPCTTLLLCGPTQTFLRGSAKMLQNVMVSLNCKWNEFSFTVWTIKGRREAKRNVKNHSNMKNMVTRLDSSCRQTGPPLCSDLFLWCTFYSCVEGGIRSRFELFVEPEVKPINPCNQRQICWIADDGRRIQYPLRHAINRPSPQSVWGRGGSPLL